MFLPFGDEPNPPGTPVVTYGLIAINVLVWVFFCAPLATQSPNPSDADLWVYLHSLGLEGLQGRSAPGLSAYDVYLYAHAYSPARASLAGLFGSLFLHAGWVHLLGNMLFLYIFGDNVEAHLGRILYLLVYLFTGALGTLCYTLFRLHSDLPVIGASGAISGVLGCYFMWFPRNRVRVFAFFFLFIDVIRIPARVVLGFYLLVENLLPLLTQHTTGGGVAYGAHLGGFLSGAGFAALYTRQKTALAQATSFCAACWAALRPGGSSTPRRSTLPPDLPAEPNLSKLARAVAACQWQDAAALEARMLRVERARESAETLLTLADGLTQERAYGAALALLQRIIARASQSRHDQERTARAHLRAGLIQWHGHHRATAAAQHLLAVLDLEADPRVQTAARQALVELEASDPSFHTP